MKNCPIGVFDSGVGGLSVFSKLINLLPNENYIYFGDTLNLPYGDKSKEQLVEISAKIFDFFKSQNVKAVVMACNTTSSVVYECLQSKYDYRIYPIVQNVSKCIAEQNYNKIGVFATNATINSHAYKKHIQLYNSNAEVFEIACPAWVNIVENELQNEKTAQKNIKQHLDEMLEYNVDKIILGCTHYPYLLDVLSKYADRDLFINPAKDFAQYIKTDLGNADLLAENKNGTTKFYVSAKPEQFISAAKLFYDVKDAEEISL